MNLSDKLFAILQEQYRSSDSLSRTALLGLSREVNEDLISALANNPNRKILDRAGRTVPIVFVNNEDQDIVQDINNRWRIPGSSLAFATCDAARAEFKKAWQTDYRQKGYGRGGQSFAVDVRNEAEQPVIYLAASKADLGASIDSAVVSFGFFPPETEVDGCGFFLESDFFLGLLPKVECETNKNWPADYSKYLKPIFDEMSNPDMAWGLLKRLNTAANESGVIDLRTFESILGVPSSEKHRLSQKILQMQTALMGSLSEMLSTSERDALFEKLEEELPGNMAEVQAFKEQVLQIDAQGAVEDCVFEMFAGEARNNASGDRIEAAWWPCLTLDVLERALPGQTAALKVNVSGQVVLRETRCRFRLNQMIPM